jgi:uncharacterized protein YecE (DUF72 family)
VRFFQLQSSLNTEFVTGIEHTLDALSLEAMAVELRRKVWVRDVLHADHDVHKVPPTGAYTACDRRRPPG